VLCCVTYSLTYKMEAVCSSDMLVSYFQTKKYHTPEDRNLQSQGYENLKYQYMISWPKATVLEDT